MYGSAWSTDQPGLRISLVYGSAWSTDQPGVSIGGEKQEWFFSDLVHSLKSHANLSPIPYYILQVNGKLHRAGHQRSASTVTDSRLVNPRFSPVRVFACETLPRGFPAFV